MFHSNVSCVLWLRIFYQFRFNFGSNQNTHVTNNYRKFGLALSPMDIETDMVILFVPHKISNLR